MLDGLTKSRAAWQLARFQLNGRVYRLVCDPNRHDAMWRRENAVGALEDVSATTA